MAAGIAHELRNPLVGIGSTASLLLDEFEQSDPRRKEIDMIFHEAKRMDRIVNQIVEYARTRELASVQFVLSDLINHILKLLSGPLQAKHLKVRTSISQGADRLHADRDQIEQVLLNVIDNAIDATPMNGLSMEIASYKLLHQEQPGIMIQVRDAGKVFHRRRCPASLNHFLHRGNVTEPDWGWLFARTLSTGVMDISI